MRLNNPRLFVEPLARNFQDLIRPVALLCVLGAAVLPLNAQEKQRSASDLLHHALYLADLYNGADAGPEFSQAEKVFVGAGDQRNALYARLGRIRATVEQGKLPATSAQLGAVLTFAAAVLSLWAKPKAAD